MTDNQNRSALDDDMIRAFCAAVGSGRVLYRSLDLVSHRGKLFGRVRNRKELRGPAK